MSLSYLLSPTFQFTNVSGKPLTNGYINLYISGTRSKYYAFSDFDGTLHPFDIPLNALGSAVILVSPAHSYDIYVYNSVGTLQMSRFNITPATGEGTVITDVTTITSKDGTVDVTANSSTDYDLSIATKIAELKAYTDQAKNDAIESANTSIADLDNRKKDKQNELNFNGSATKTVKKITQYPNGELNVEFEDIDLLGYNITSSDGSINVSTSEGVTDLTLSSDVVRDSKYTHIDAATANPLMDGIASAGISTKYAREDHVHPSDTSKEDIVNKTTVILGTSDSKYPTDKAVAEFVNSSIATNTANYISNNGEPFTSVEQLEAYSGPVTNNDYAFVTGTDSEGNTYYDKYKATVSGSTVAWALEYRLNNSSFTAAQWAAINSGITATDVSNLANKMDKQTVGDASTPIYLNNGVAQEASGVNSHINDSSIHLPSVLPISRGGTGADNRTEAEYNLLGSISDSEVTDETTLDNRKIPLVNSSISITNGVFRFLSFSVIWNWIKHKLGISTSGSSTKYLNEQGEWSDTIAKARAVVDYGATSKAIEIGWSGKSIQNPTYFAVYTDSENGYNKAIKDCSLENVKKAINGTSVGSNEVPIFINANGAPQVCTLVGVPYTFVNYGNANGYGVFVGGAHNLANSSRIYCTFLVTATLYNDNIAHTYIGTFSFRGGILNSELKCLTGTPAYPLRISVVYNKDGGTTANPTYTLGLYVIPPDKTTKYSSYSLTRIASNSDFIWDAKAINSAAYDELNSVAKPALKPIILTWDAGGSNLSTTGGTWIPTFDKATIIDCRGIVDMSIQVDLSIIGQRTYIGNLASYEITLVNSSKTDILPESLHQTGRMPRQANSSSSTIDGTIDISHTHRFIFPITSTTNLLAGYRPKITLPSNYTLDSGAQVNIKALCRGIVLPYGADEYF